MTDWLLPVRWIAYDLCRNKIVFAACLAALTVELLVLGLLFSIFLYRERVIPPYASELKAVLYLRSGTTPEERDNLARLLGKWPEIENVAIVSKEEARRRIESQLGEWKGILGGTDETLMPSSLEIQFKAKFSNAKDINLLAEKMRKIQQVDEVVHGSGLVDKLTPILGSLGSAARLVGVLLCLFLTVTPFCLTELIFRRRKNELEIYSLVGATQASIKGPFYLLTAFLAVVSSACASSILVYILHVVRLALPLPLSGAFFLKSSELLMVGAGLAGSGVLFGLLGSWLALRRALKGDDPVGYV